MILTESQVRNYLSSAGFSGQALSFAVKICQCESGFNTQAHNTTGEDSRGLMQINVSANANPQYSYLNLFDPAINTRVAFEIFQARGKNFRDWTCARNLGLVYPSTDIPFLPLALIGLVFYISL